MSSTMTLARVSAALDEPLVQMSLALVGIALVFLFIFAHSVILNSSQDDDKSNQLSAFESYVKIVWSYFVKPQAGDGSRSQQHVVLNSSQSSEKPEELSAFKSYVRFAWSCFVKPHTGDGSHNQQDALESFYQAQASVYDSTRLRLLRGREDMLGLVAAQLKTRMLSGTVAEKPIWIDMGGGTGFNIESMSKFVDVPSFFSAVYVVDLSPSLCQVARERFARLGWKNVTVVCEDARQFRLEDYEKENKKNLSATEFPRPDVKSTSTRADLITMSYSLSMIPDYYSVVDSISSLLSKDGVIGVADFYVQSEVDYQCRNYTGGEIDRHCMWISRVFWRTWFEADRVSLEAARRDYLEYRFGTVLSFNGRCKLFGLRIPYYVWIGCSKDLGSAQRRLEELNAAVTESPFISALDQRNEKNEVAQQSSAMDIRSKAYESAIVNLSASLPLPPSWYQAHHWRIYFDDQLAKYKQFTDGYIYAFTWEDSKVDARILKINENDVILAITSAGDNILSYALEKPKRIHAVDLNPAQNHLLELKLAAFTVLGRSDVWQLFGEGRHSSFRDLLITKLSPHMSSLAFQYWLHHGPDAFRGAGLYHTGGSGRALKLVNWLVKLVGVKRQVAQLCATQTLNEQNEIWHRSIRRILLSRLLAWTVIGNKRWLWRALGVPTAQRDMIEHDYSSQEPTVALARNDSDAIWSYAVNTLDPVISNTLLSCSNHYYLLTLLGRYTAACHPDYLAPKAHAKLSRPGAFDGIRIHTDEIAEVVERMAPGTLTIAVLMDSMDWFAPGSSAAETQISKVRRALKVGGRVLLRSAGMRPWYVDMFEGLGFAVKRVAVRMPGECMDRVNMYASTWICTKVADNSPSAPRGSRHDRAGSFEPLSIGEAMQSD